MKLNKEIFSTGDLSRPVGVFTAGGAEVTSPPSTLTSKGD